MQEFKFEMPANLEFVPVIRVAIQSIAFIFGFNDKEAYEIEFVVDEICNNAIEHGSKGKGNVITMECKFDKQYVEINFKDSGSPHFKVDEILEEDVLQLETAFQSLEDRRGVNLIFSVEMKVPVDPF